MAKTNRVWADTRVVEADVKYPTESGLLTKAIGKTAGLVGRAQKAGAGARAVVVDHVDASRRYAHAIGTWLRRRTGESRNEALAITGQIAEPVAETMADATEVATNGRAFLRRKPDTPRLGRLALLTTVWRGSSPILARTSDADVVPSMH